MAKVTMSEWAEQVKKPVPILLVEDNHTDLQTFALSTAAFHREILEARSGEEAMRIFESRPDVRFVVLDERLPGMSGIEVFKKIKASRPSTIVVFMTGMSGPFVSTVNEIGYAAVVCKPMHHVLEFLESMMTCFGIPKKPNEPELL